MPTADPAASNPKDYADNQDARRYDPRLRPPIRQVELDIDPQTGMKNYIANERGDWATSAAYIRYSISRSIRYGRKYTSAGRKGDERDLAEGLRCLGQGLHTMEDFGAHTNYCELALREMGFFSVFPHTGVETQILLHGHYYVFPLVTGTFGMVDFLHSVLGEATDHFTQSEVNEMDIALGDAQSSTSSSGSLSTLTGLLGKVPGTRDLVTEAEELKSRSEAQESANRNRGAHFGYADYQEPDHGFARAKNGSTPSGLADIDPNQTVAKVYPILRFRDKVVRMMTSVIEKIPGLEALVEKISETLTVFIMSLLAPFIRPIINTASNSLHTGSSGVIAASGKHQYEPWTDPICTDPTHSLLSKDHFSNILNEPAGLVATAILQYAAPRILYAWDHVDVPEQQVLDDCVGIFHHPALRNMHNEAHRSMFEAVQTWVQGRPDRGASLHDILSAEGVRAGKNNTGQDDHAHGGHHHFAALGGGGGYGAPPPPQQNQPASSSSIPWDRLSQLPIPGMANLQRFEGTISNIMSSGSGRTRDGDENGNGYYSSQQQPPPGPPGRVLPPGSHYPAGSAGDYYSQPQPQPQPPPTGLEYGPYYPQYDHRNYHGHGHGQHGWHGGHAQYPPYPGYGQGHHGYGYGY